MWRRGAVESHSRRRDSYLDDYVEQIVVIIEFLRHRTEPRLLCPNQKLVKDPRLGVY